VDEQWRQSKWGPLIEAAILTTEQELRVRGELLPSSQVLLGWTKWMRDGGFRLSDEDVHAHWQSLESGDETVTARAAG